jgi:Zn-dependent protease with chaperone function
MGSGRRRRHAHRFGPLLVAVAVALALVRVAGADPASDEVRLGARIAKEIEARYGVVTDPAQVERITRVGEIVARAVDRRDLTYRFKILKINGVNALSLPGGWVYVTEGMMKFVRTDDELAAVLAHELAHIAHRHYYIQEERSRQMLPALILGTALSVLAHSAAPLAGAQILTEGALAAYQRDLEKDADLTAVTYLTHTPYSPVAMLTVMEHLAEADRLSAHPDPGIYQDHPEPEERVAYLREDLIRLGIPIVRRPAEGYLRISVEPPAPAPGQPVTIRVDGHPVVTLGATVNGDPPAGRARAMVSRLDAFFNTDPAPYEVRAVHLLDRWSVIGGEQVLFDVTPEDAAYAKTTPAALAEAVRARLADVIAAAPYNRKF